MSALDTNDSVPLFKEGRMVWRGVIQNNPGDLSIKVNVIIPDMNPNIVWGPCNWQSRDALSVPHRGDVCLIIFDNTKEPWVVAWWPFEV
jgi:hypothetical protein